MNRQMTSDLSPNETVVQARQSYLGMLAKRGLVDFSGVEVDNARSTLQVQGRMEIESDDIAFQAAIARLQRRNNLAPHAVESIFKELMLAEYDCDQAEWERECWRAADLTHAKHAVLAKKAKL